MFSQFLSLQLREHFVTVTTRLARLLSSSSLRVHLRSDLGGCNSTGDDCRRAYSCAMKIVRQDSTKHLMIKILFTIEEYRTVQLDCDIQRLHVSPVLCSTSINQQPCDLDCAKQPTYRRRFQTSAYCPRAAETDRYRPQITGDTGDTGVCRPAYCTGMQPAAPYCAWPKFGLPPATSQ
jgi:hypothetical protein